MSLYRRALALLEELAGEGVELEHTSEGLDLCGEPSEALERRLEGFCAVAAVDGHESTHAPSMAPEEAAELLRKARDASPAFRALVAVVRAPSRAARELLTLDVAIAGKLPVPFTLHFARKQTVCVATTSKQVYTQALGHHPVFRMRELEAAAIAVELGRAGPERLDQWLEAKSRGEWILTPELAGADIPGAPPVPSMCIGALLDALGAELVQVDVHEVAAEPRKGAAA